MLDPFAGSGTTGYVAAMQGKSSILCELNKEYEPIIMQRIKEASESLESLENRHPIQVASWNV